MPFLRAVVVAILLQIAASAAISLSPGSGQPGSSFVVSGGGFVPGDRVRVLWDGSNLGGNTQVDASGNFTYSGTIPSGASPGAHTVEAKGRDSGSSYAGFEVLVTGQHHASSHNDCPIFDDCGPTNCHHQPAPECLHNLHYTNHDRCRHSNNRVTQTTATVRPEAVPSMTTTHDGTSPRAKRGEPDWSGWGGFGRHRSAGRLVVPIQESQTRSAREGTRSFDNRTSTPDWRGDAPCDGGGGRVCKLAEAFVGACTRREAGTTDSPSRGVSSPLARLRATMGREGPRSGRADRTASGTC